MGREAISSDEALATPIDPVGRPGDYQALLLTLLGDGDPAEVQDRLPDELSSLVEKAGPHVRIRPRPGEWSVLECVGHLLDSEVVYAARYRWILAQDEPRLIGYDQDLWVERLRHNEADPGEMLELFRALRRAHLALWFRSSAEERARLGVHEERGPESFELSFRLIAGHGLFHAAQARRTLETVRLAQPSR